MFNKTRKFLKKLNCSPLSKKLSSSRKIKNISCLTDNSLRKMVQYWNLRHPDNKILTMDPYEIWNFFKQTFNSVCSNERCWLRQKFIESNNKDLLKYFSPFSPKIWKKKPYTWLNSDDIEKIMAQYEDAYPYFQFIGPSPIDFDKIIKRNQCVWDDLCKFSLENKIKKNISKIGIIFNTDPHEKSGKHWICLFIDIKNSFISFFDSNGTKIPKQVKTLVDRIQNQGHHIGIDLKYYDNLNKIHQKNDGQCGMYTLYYIIELLLENKSPQFFKETRITDEIMRDYRSIYFN